MAGRDGRVHVLAGDDQRKSYVTGRVVELEKALVRLVFTQVEKTA